MATEDILINVTPQETRVAILLAGVVQELLIERSTTRGLVGNIYVGRVVRVLPGMQSAFIDVGMERAAFLHVADIWEARGVHVEHRGGGHHAPDRKPIETLIHEGDALLVQVIKDPIGTKGARLSTQVSLAGRNLVFLPQDSHIGVSQRIESEAERAQLRERLARLMPSEGSGGFIVRTSAEDASEDDLARDIAYLRKRWSQIQQGSSQAAPPALLYEELSLAQRVLRDLVTEQTRAVLVDSRENHAALSAFAAEFVPGVDSRVLHYSGERPLFDLHLIDEEIERALARRVDLKSGGYLVIDQTEAMTTIDVNTGAFVGTRNFDDTIFKTNLEAAHAIARQLRLRNLGGIIVIDFIDMTSGEHRDAVLAELRRALARDRTRMTVSEFTQLGLVEMTRKRTRESLAHILCESCPVCQGRGELKTARTVCYDILREILREARQFGDAKQFRILASQKVIDIFLEEESNSLAMLSDFIGKPISMQVETLYHQEQFDIVLM